MTQPQIELPKSSPYPIAEFSSCEISDALVKLGVHSGGHIPDITMFSPSRDAEDVKICGPAYTVKMVHAKDTHSPKPAEHFVDAAPAGHVMIIAAPPQAKSAVWGGLMSAGAQSRGVLGVIISGRCRDLSEHRSLNFPVFARGHSTLGQGSFSRPSQLNVPLEIHPIPDPHTHNEGGETVYPFPATIVNPGDILLADVDGVVCVPNYLVEEVVARCTKAREIDARCMEDIKAGNPIAVTFKKWRG